MPKITTTKQTHIHKHKHTFWRVKTLDMDSRANTDTELQTYMLSRRTRTRKSERETSVTQSLSFSCHINIRDLFVLWDKRLPIASFFIIYYTKNTKISFCVCEVCARTIFLIDFVVVFSTCILLCWLVYLKFLYTTSFFSVCHYVMCEFFIICSYKSKIGRKFFSLSFLCGLVIQLWVHALWWHRTTDCLEQ